MTTEKTKEIFGEVWLLEKEGCTEFLADPTALCAVIVHRTVHDHVSSCCFFVFFF